MSGVEFVKAKRPKWGATATSRLCSVQFKHDDFMRRFHNLEGQGQASVIPRLIRDEIGVAPAPVATVHATPTNMNDDTGSYRLSLLLSEASDSVKLIFAQVCKEHFTSPIAIY